MNDALIDSQQCHSLCYDLYSDDKSQVRAALSTVLTATENTDDSTRPVAMPCQIIEAAVAHPSCWIAEYIDDNKLSVEADGVTTFDSEIFQMITVVCCRLIDHEVRHQTELVELLLKACLSTLSAATFMCVYSDRLVESDTLIMMVALFKTFMCNYFICNDARYGMLRSVLQFFDCASVSQAAQQVALGITKYLIQFESSQGNVKETVHAHLRELFEDLHISEYIFSEIQSATDSPSPLSIAYLQLAETVAVYHREVDANNSSFFQVARVYEVAIPPDCDNIFLATRALNAMIKFYRYFNHQDLLYNDYRDNVAGALTNLYRRWFYMMYRYPTREHAYLKLHKIEQNRRGTACGAAYLPYDLVRDTETHYYSWRRDHLFMTHERATQWQRAIFAYRAITVCIGLHNLRLPALQLTMIMEADQFAEAAPFHWQWLIATTVKHWFDNK